MSQHLCISASTCSTTTTLAGDHSEDPRLWVSPPAERCCKRFWPQPSLPLVRASIESIIRPTLVLLVVLRHFLI